MELDLHSIGIAVFGAVAFCSTLRLWWTGASRRWRLARRSRRAARGEREAEALLARRGYRVIERQARGTLEYRVDGEPCEVGVRADLLVARGGRRFVAEVKTGENAPRPTNIATRRQLLEYAHAFEVDGVLLVDPERDLVREIGLPVRSARSRRWPWLIAGAAIGAAATRLVLAVYG